MICERSNVLAINFPAVSIHFQAFKFPSTCEHLRSLAVATCDCLPRRLIFPILFFSLFYTFPICLFWFLYLRLHIFTLHYSTDRSFLPLRSTPRSHSRSSRLHSLLTCASATPGPSPVTPLLLRTRPKHCAPLTHLLPPPWFCFCLGLVSAERITVTHKNSLTSSSLPVASGSLPLSLVHMSESTIPRLPELHHDNSDTEHTDIQHGHLNWSESSKTDIPG
jgi:hypothetical protein